jgi:hypothetical protein
MSDQSLGILIWLPALTGGWQERWSMLPTSTFASFGPDLFLKLILRKQKEE